MPRRLVPVAASVVVCGIGVAAAATADRAKSSTCTISGFLSDTDPKGTVVRNAPRADAPVIGRLPPRAPLAPGGDELFGAEFDILGAENGWLLIGKAEAEINDHYKVVFEGQGWIPGDKAGFIIGSPELRAAPARKAEITAKLRGEMKDGGHYGADSFKVLRVHACQGRFVEVTIAPPAGARGNGAPMRGWVNNVCGNQKTTCDSSVVDPDDRK
jgi:hypothetical protein